MIFLNVSIVAVAIAYNLDQLFGDPYWFPHPVRFIGKYINFLEKKLNLDKYNKKFTGLVLLLIVMTTVYILIFWILKISSFNSIFKLIIESFIIYTIFATKCLSLEGKKIAIALKENNTEKARQLISYLVSRDTENMNEKDIVKATVETLTENIVDGIVSPIFFLAIGGAPLAYLYKSVNTLDSMVGYKNKKYIDFGWASARFDDLLNYIPARLGALLVVLSAFILRLNYKNSFKIMLRDRFNHSSPNSAYPESAAAGALDIELGGKASYFGKVENKPTMGDDNKTPNYRDIENSVYLVNLVSIISIVLLIIFRVVFF
ncbi:cobalamin biosynthesis protein [Helicovermis profundi]|uniref:Cobalamin biosynthesis protein CobD n=1 Tax=Helicovermis profundi TaxID=3065157 RepID=A0AAU9EDJ7_9FIRM|nr:adenosylcobinamide-phosphate synthase CbiB [Clostridia bacterium S502]